MRSTSSAFVSLRSSRTSARTSMSPSPPPPKTTPPGTRGTAASTNVLSGARCPNGGTVPGTKPEATTVSSGVASRTRRLATPSARASFLTSTRVSPFETTTTNAPSAAKTSDLTIWETSTPRAAALDATSGVSSPSQRTSSTSAPRASIHRARSTDVSTRAEGTADARREVAADDGRFAEAVADEPVPSREAPWPIARAARGRNAANALVGMHLARRASSRTACARLCARGGRGWGKYCFWTP